MRTARRIAVAYESLNLHFYGVSGVRHQQPKGWNPGYS
jgi:hypothetical protein